MRRQKVVKGPDKIRADARRRQAKHREKLRSLHPLEWLERTARIPSELLADFNSETLQEAASVAIEFRTGLCLPVIAGETLLALERRVLVEWYFRSRPPLLPSGRLGEPVDTPKLNPEEIPDLWIPLPGAETFPVLPEPKAEAKIRPPLLSQLEDTI